MFNAHSWSVNLLIFATTATLYSFCGVSTVYATSTPTFVQEQDSRIASGTTLSVALSRPNSAGNLLVVYVIWSNTSSVTLHDTKGNTYTGAVTQTQWSSNHYSAEVFCAKNIAAGSNTVTATFVAPLTFGIMYVHEYSGMDTVSPLDAGASSIGTSPTMTGGPVVTTTAGDLLFGAAASMNTVTAAGSGYVSRSTHYGNMTEDKLATIAGSYSVTGTQNGAAWVFQSVAFKAAGTASPQDTTPPSIPTGLSATTLSPSQINLSWNPSTDNVGVTGYRIFRNSSQIATTTTTSYADSGLASNSTYSYTVAAYDAAGNTSAQSQPATATTTAATATASFVQVNAATPQSNQSAVTVNYTNAQTAGNLNVIAVGWNDTISSVTSVTDTSGNLYQAAAPVVRGSALSQVIYYANNIKGAAAGANSVTVQFNQAAVAADVRILEYNGLDPTSPFDVIGSGTGSGGTASSGVVSVASTNELLLGAGMTTGAFTGPGTGFAKRIITSPDADIAEDENVTEIAGYSATAPVTGAWIMQVAAFRTTPAAPDTTPPSIPVGLIASPVSASQINITWSASTDNVGVAGYKVFRNSIQIAATATTSYSDGGLTANTTYSYAVAAFDPSGNLSGLSATVTAKTLAPDTQPPTIPSNLAAAAVSSSQINLSWTASTDNVGVTGYKVYRNSAQIASTSTTSYSDTGLSATTTYNYSVAAFDAAGNVSSLSQVATATTTAGSYTAAYPLNLSANKRYLIDQNNVPFLMIGDAPQSLIGDLSEANASAYFADRKAAGINAVWINLLCNAYTYCNSNGTTFDGLAPFTVTGDISTPNDAYFKRVDDMINVAAQNGIVVFLDPIETGGWLPVLRNNGLTKAFNYGVYVGNRYKAMTNIVWLSGNDFQTWRTTSDNNLARQVMAGIASVDPGHLQSIELDYDASYSNEDSALGTYLGLNGAYTYYETYDEVLQAYNSAPTLPVIMLEANYEFENNTGFFSGPTGALILREQEYWTMLSGGFGQFYGNHYTVTSTWPSDGNLDTPGVTELAFFRNLFSAYSWWSLVPDQSHAFVTGGYGTYNGSDGNIPNATYCTTAFSADGSLAMTYCPTNTTLTVNMAAMAGAATAQWYDPSNGSYLPISGSPFANSGTHQFTTPGKNHAGDGDWVLVLKH